MSDLISKKELYHKLGEAYNKGYLSWGANEIVKDIIGECDPVENKDFEGMTNREVFMCLFPDVAHEEQLKWFFGLKWWNTPYKAESVEA